jgi:hypothetical protein
LYGKVDIMNINNLTSAERLSLAIMILGTDTSTDPQLRGTWTSSGAQGNRNVLTTDEKVVTRLLNALDSTSRNALETANALGARISEIVGAEASTDRLAFESLGGNLIQAVADLKKNGGGAGGNRPVIWPLATAVPNVQALETALPNFSDGDFILSVADGVIDVLGTQLQPGDVVSASQAA